VIPSKRDVIPFGISNIISIRLDDKEDVDVKSHNCIVEQQGAYQK
jgi:hypothetical protein